MTIEKVAHPGSDPGYKIYKGVNQIFAGSEGDARIFLATYETERPGLFEGSIYGYQE